MLPGTEVLFVNPRRKRRAKSRRGASAKQRAWRKKFGAMYGGGRAANPKPKARKARRRTGGATMKSITRGGHPVSRKAWRASGYRRNPRRRYSNPRLRLTAGGIMQTVGSAAQGAVGATLVDLAMGQLLQRQLIPATMLTQTTYPLIKGAVAIGLGLLAQSLPLPAGIRNFGSKMAEGSLTVTLTQALRSFLPADLTMGRRVGYWQSGQTLPPRMSGRGMGRYLRGNSTDLMASDSAAFGPGFAAQGAMSAYLRK